MSSRITYDLVKKWLSESTLAQEKGFRLTSFNGFYYILDSTGNIIVSGETARECWEHYSTYKAGYFEAMRDMKEAKHE